MSYDAWFDGCFDLGPDKEKWPEIFQLFWSDLERSCTSLRRDILRWLSKKVCKEDKSLQKELINLLQQVKLMLKKFHTEEFGKRDEESFLSAWDDYQDIVCSFENATSDE